MNSDRDSGKRQAASAWRNNASCRRTIVRLDSRELFAHAREVEISHGGRIYKLRITQQNKLILTA